MGPCCLACLCFLSLLSCSLTLSLDWPSLAFLLFLQNRNSEGVRREYGQLSSGAVVGRLLRCTPGLTPVTVMRYHACDTLCGKKDFADVIRMTNSLTEFNKKRSSEWAWANHMNRLKPTVFSPAGLRSGNQRLEVWEGFDLRDGLHWWDGGDLVVRTWECLVATESCL